MAERPWKFESSRPHQSRRFYEVVRDDFATIAPSAAVGTGSLTTAAAPSAGSSFSNPADIASTRTPYRPYGTFSKKKEHKIVPYPKFFF